MLPVSKYTPQRPVEPKRNSNPILTKFKIKPSHEKPYDPSNTYKYAYSSMMKKYSDLKIGGMPLRKPDKPEDFDCNAYLLTEKMINAAISSQITPETNNTNSC